MTTTKTYTIQQILAAWIANNNPSAAKVALVNNGLLASGANPSKTQMSNTLYNYYLTRGNVAFLNLLKAIPLSANTSTSDKVALANTAAELKASYGGVSMPMYSNNSRVASSNAREWWDDVIDTVLGHSTTTAAPTVTTSTTTSPLVIIAGVLLVLGLAYFLVGKRAA